jgi:hypothetical protein
LVFAGVVAAAIAAVLSAGAVSVAIAADSCANAPARAQTGSTGLPDCRGYEMVSSPYKEGFYAEPVVALRFTDGGVVSYESTGTFAGNPLPGVFNQYNATRLATGWATTAISPPGQFYDNAGSGGYESDDLRTSLWYVFSRRGVTGDTPGYYLRGPDGAMTHVGDTGILNVAGKTPDLSHIVYAFGPTPLYEHVGTGNGFPRTVSVDNNGHVDPGCFHSISSDGRVIVYSTGCPPAQPQVWARIGGSVSVAVSASQCTRTADDLGGLCNGFSTATYEGGAVDGSRVFFTTRQQLVNGDTDANSDLYACDIPAGVPAPVGMGRACTSWLRGCWPTILGLAWSARVRAPTTCICGIVAA